MQVAQAGQPQRAALASPLAGEIYGLDRLADEIEDRQNNTTRFLIMSRQPDFSRRSNARGGATMMTAGLIQQRNKAAITGLPGLINLPIIGALFRSRDYQRQETELMIMVTPYIAKPMEPRQVSRPDDGFVDAQDAQAILLGRFNRLYGVAGASPLGSAYRGRVGFITD